MIPYDDHLRQALAANIAAHTRHTIALDGRRHAAVAIVVVDSDAERDGVDDSDIRLESLQAIPSPDPRVLADDILSEYVAALEKKAEVKVYPENVRRVTGGEY